jgi:hypothetical protein
VTSPGIRSPITPRGALSGVRDCGDRETCRAGTQRCSLRAPTRTKNRPRRSSPPGTSPWRREVRRRVKRPRRLPVRAIALTPAGRGVASSAPAPVPELALRVFTTSLLAVASSPRWLSWGFCSTTLGIAASGSDVPFACGPSSTPASGPSARPSGDRPEGVPWRCRSSPFPSLHLPSGARSRFPGPCPPGVFVSGLPAPHAPLQGFAPRFVGPADDGCRLPVARLGFPSRVLAAVALVTGSSSQARTRRVAGVSPDRPPSRFQHRPPSVAAPGALETHKRLR